MRERKRASEKAREKEDLEALDAEDAEVPEAVVEVVVQLEACWHPHDPPNRLRSHELGMREQAGRLETFR